MYPSHSGLGLRRHDRPCKLPLGLLAAISLVSLVLLPAGLAAGAAAAPVAGASGGNSAMGQVGLLELPTALTPPSGTLAVGYGRLAEDFVFLDYGFGSQLELTVRLEGLGQGAELVPGMKYLILGPDAGAGKPGIAVGLDSGSAYAVLSHYVGAYQLSLHGGVGTGRFEGLMLGVEKSFPSGKGGKVPFYGPSALFAEYVGSRLNVGARVFITPGLSVTLGLEGLSDLTCGVCYRFRM